MSVRVTGGMAKLRSSVCKCSKAPGVGRRCRWGCGRKCRLARYGGGGGRLVEILGGMSLGMGGWEREQKLMASQAQTWQTSSWSFGPERYPRFWQADGTEGQEPMVSQARTGREEGEEAGGRMVRSNAPTERRAEGREGGG